MGHNDSHRGARIARNTLMLYVRMLVLMLVGLYTSRVVLEALGETDFGVYNVVGGVVAMFTIISGALNSAVQRFITFEMGKTEGADLNKVYSTAVNIQLILAAIIVILAEPIGIWFINNEMTISPDRIKAAEWVLHFSLLAFVINLMSVPQMASITAHEKMSAYAWIGILDGLLRLGTALLIMHSGGERLIQYSVLMAVTVIIVRAAYGIYCRRHFEECRYRPVFDRKLTGEMFAFAGWNFVGVTSGVLRDQGGNILVNLFSGPAVNAARGMAVQLNGAVQGFVTNFMTAVNPQITKSYASGDHGYMFSLVRRSSRMSFYLLLMMVIPLLLNTDTVLSLWLKDVPAHTTLFVQLFLIFALSESLSNPMITAMLATGRIRNYQLVVGGIQLLNIPVSYYLLKMGAAPEITVAVAIALSQVCLFARLVMLNRATGFPIFGFISKVYIKSVLVVMPLAMSVPLIFDMYKPAGLWGTVVSVAVCIVWTALIIYFVGTDREEKGMLKGLLTKRREG
ncbi:MAG: lipopolysaccharide biosynthesis protein [Bacteroidales bacterium]|nr:lipopolysaccharide biosynthesis protein [Bacteroidales bacterium]